MDLLAREVSPAKEQDPSGSDRPLFDTGRIFLEHIHQRAAIGDLLALQLLDAIRKPGTLDETLGIPAHVRRGYLRQRRDFHLAQAFVELVLADPSQTKWAACTTLAALAPDVDGTAAQSALWRAEQQGVGIPTTSQGIQNIIEAELDETT